MSRDPRLTTHDTRSAVLISGTRQGDAFEEAREVRQPQALGDVVDVPAALVGRQRGCGAKLRQRRVKDGIDHREGRGQVVIRLISVETGMTVKEISVPDGGRVEIGDLLARLGSGSAEDDGQTGEARLSVDFPDAEEIDPFE